MTKAKVNIKCNIFNSLEIEENIKLKKKSRKIKLQTNFRDKKYL